MIHVSLVYFVAAAAVSRCLEKEGKHEEGGGEKLHDKQARLSRGTEKLLFFSALAQIQRSPVLPSNFSGRTFIREVTFVSRELFRSGVCVCVCVYVLFVCDCHVILAQDHITVMYGQIGLMSMQPARIKTMGSNGILND